MRGWKLKVYRQGKQWRWQLKSSNGKIVAASSEGFCRETRCRENAWLTLIGMLACHGEALRK